MRIVPIIFSGPMVLALLAGHKTMTRRLVWRYREVDDPSGTGSKRTEWMKVERGDLLWVRESLTCVGDGLWRYTADNGDLEVSARGPLMAEMVAWVRREERGKVSPIHMPKFASRLVLEVLDRKVERLQSISRADCLAEGVRSHGRGSPKSAFRELWSKLHGCDSWNADPMVVAFKFKVHRANVLSMMKEAA